MSKGEKNIFYGIIGAFLLLFLFWATGYVCNGLIGTKFDLASCWAGVVAIGSPGVLMIIKYVVDSVANSPRGQTPQAQPTTEQRGIDTSEKGN